MSNSWLTNCRYTAYRYLMIFVHIFLAVWTGSLDFVHRLFHQPKNSPAARHCRLTRFCCLGPKGISMMSHGLVRRSLLALASAFGFWSCSEFPCIGCSCTTPLWKLTTSEHRRWTWGYSTCSFSISALCTLDTTTGFCKGGKLKLIDEVFHRPPELVPHAVATCCNSFVPLF